MTIERIEPSSLENALNDLNVLYRDEESCYIFRGQLDSEWFLESPFDRYWAGKSIGFSETVRRMLAQYKTGIQIIGANPGIPKDDNVSWMEHGRHHDLPVPLIDFSWSPLVALFFAYNGMSHKKTPNPSLYAINIRKLARHVAASEKGRSPGGTRKEMDRFIYGGRKGLKELLSHPESPLDDKLLFISQPGPYTDRLFYQLGVFIFSTFENNLELILDEIDEGGDDKVCSDCTPIQGHSHETVAVKFTLDGNWTSKVFHILGASNISARNLMRNAEGVARDVENSYFYNLKGGYLSEDYI